MPPCVVPLHSDHLGVGYLLPDGWEDLLLEHLGEFAALDREARSAREAEAAAAAWLQRRFFFVLVDGPPERRPCCCGSVTLSRAIPCSLESSDASYILKRVIRQVGKWFI